MQNLEDKIDEITHNLWESAQGKEPRITKFKAAQAIQALITEQVRLGRIMECERLDPYIHPEFRQLYEQELAQLKDTTLLEGKK